MRETTKAGNMNITIASGKGGTGKTTLAVNLARFLASDGGAPVRLLDCDVEEPNCHLFVDSGEMSEEDVTVLKPVWDAEKCVLCGKCVDACRYNALALAGKELIVFNELCHSCGACSYVCPSGALEERPSKVGVVRSSAETASAGFLLAYGLLNIGEARAPVVVEAVRQHIAEDAVNVVDAPPGTGCGAVASIQGADRVILVTEPTPFGLNDLALAVDLNAKLGARTGIVINRSGRNDGIIEEFAESRGVTVIGKIPFSRKYAEAYSSGGMLVEEFPEFRGFLEEIYANALALGPDSVPETVEPEEDKPLVGKLSGDGSETGTNTAEPPKTVVVLSGKGGTGKTTVTAALAKLAGEKTLFDADVDAADLHLLIPPVETVARPYHGGAEARIDSSACAGCGRCARQCHFNAINLSGPGNDFVGATYAVDPLACEGCGLCELVCPVDAVKMETSETGKLYRSRTADGTMVHAKLGVGAENSGKLVSEVRNAAAEAAEKEGATKTIGDGPPGTSCPVIASVTGADLALMVTEPTVSGVHDLERVMELTRHFGVETLVVVNKADLNDEVRCGIYALAEKLGSEVAAEIPFDSAVSAALENGATVLDYEEAGEVADRLRALWKTIAERL